MPEIIALSSRLHNHVFARRFIQLPFSALASFAFCEFSFLLLSLVWHRLMDIAALLTSAGINIGVCVVLFSLYSVLRKQPSNRIVYFGRRLASARLRGSGQFFMERSVSSPGWMVKAWEATEHEILAMGGLHGVVFKRLLVFSIRAFSIAAIICIFLVLPVNYYGQGIQHEYIHAELLDRFTIGSVDAGSK